MKVSAVGFLFSKSIQKGGIKGENYTCILHKIKPDGNYTKNTISSPILDFSKLETVSPNKAKANIVKSLLSIKHSDDSSKFIGATIKDGIKETEVHSLFSDKLFAVRTKDSGGKNHFRILGKDKTHQLLAENLDCLA